MQINTDKNESAQRLDTADEATFKARVLELSRRHSALAQALMAGTVQMLGFAQLRDRLGPAWDQVRDRVHGLAESVIKQHLAPGDLFLKISDERFIVLFDRATRADGEAKARAIATSLEERLGAAREHGSLIQVRAVAIALDPKLPPQALASPQALAQSVQKAEHDSETREREAFARIVATLKVAYWPVANLRKRLISMYDAALPELSNGQPPESPGGTGAFHCELDCFALAKAAEVLARAHLPRHKAVLMAPIHYDTLAARAHRTRYVEACKALPKGSSRRLLLQIVDFPVGTPQGRLHQLLSVVGPFFAGFVFRVPLGFRPSDLLTGLRLRGFAVDGGHWEHFTKAELEQLHQLVEGAHKHGYRTWFLGARSLAVATLAKRLDFDYLNGAAVFPRVPEPGLAFSIR
jgi:GGDEF domain-containing protein